MNKSPSKYELELRLAPSVEPEWSEEFIIEARLLDVPGAEIGEALAEIDSHVRESGETARSAFGDPRAYAAGLAETSAAPSRSAVWSVLPAAAQTIGMMAALNALPDALVGAPFEITVGMLVSVTLLGLVFSLMVWRSTPMLRLILDRPVLAILLSGALLASVVAAMFIPGTVTSIWAWSVVGIGVTLLLAATVVGLSRDLKRTDDDPIRAPLASPEKHGWSWLSWANHLLIPVFTVVIAVVIVATI
ncbi:HAAS signaling domain-containing protein [Tessaracoccus oleiagri]|uniref:Uncharacterized protein n=1 Tax=Tessaracoccus oleiagri TaxID=686624 RepID=A0A1G9JD58_9ACTN|nr:hypothetical protein [Tessaracoccus oleiagri]SDL35480.1 hypothetical protein SAMN04488242_1183 [Tessaracoccus oleiagri]